MYEIHVWDGGKGDSSFACILRLSLNRLSLVISSRYKECGKFSVRSTYSSWCGQKFCPTRILAAYFVPKSHTHTHTQHTLAKFGAAPHIFRSNLGREGGM